MSVGIMKKIISIIIIGILFFVNYGTSAHLVTTETDFDLIIIAPEKFISSLQPLAEHKNSHGIKTLIKDVDEILVSQLDVLMEK